MGKRKERRLAAMSASNRRVKLDLFAEPSGEEKGNSINEEVGGDQEQDHSASGPLSPSLSGKKQENPLLLLGQYSDEELDDEAGELLKDAVDACCSVQPDGKAKEHLVASENLGSNKDEVIEGTASKQEADQVGTPKELNANDARDIENDCVDVEHCETDLIVQACASEPSESQVNGHVNGHWKLVLHEQSKQYYYWNTSTGETSWEVPAALALDSQNTDEQNVSATIEETVTSSVEAHTFPNENNEMAIYMQVSSAGGCQSSEDIIVNKDTGGYENMEFKSGSFYDTNLNIGQHSTDNVTASHGNLSGYSSLSEPLTVPVRLHHPLVYEEKDDHPSRQSDSYGSYSGEDAHSSQLVKYAEVLLQKLDMLFRSAPQLEGYEGIRKELDIRISDCKALSSYGSSLLPLWWHIEAQLKQIEFAINKSEASELVQSEDFSNMAARQKAPKDSGDLEVPEKDHTIIDTSGAGSDMAENENACTESTMKIEFEPQGSDHPPEVVPEANLMPDSAIAAPTMIHNAEDDMDVEMEVDDETPTAPTVVSFATTVCPSPAEQLIQINVPSSQCPSLTSEESNVPPPPEEEWIPPPPPEGEPLPPPPPPESEMDLPPEEPIADFPSYTETVPYPYPDQYNVGYHIPAYDSYSSSVAEVSNGSYYGNAGGNQLTESETQAYYDPLAASALAEVSLGVGPYGSAPYYDISGAVVSSGPVYSNREPSEFFVESGAVNFKDVALATDHSSAAKLSVDSVGSCLPKVRGESQISTLKASTILSTSQTSGASLGNDRSFDTQPLAVTKNQSKVVRSKKRAVTVAPTLRSNKKVSSLVDKWKAAKEELHGDDDEEPENPLEILEKKRQKEIEEWRARQVATGDAQDNANFVPLGGDWRERVKRRRTAQLKAEDAQTSTVLVEKKKKQPDLDEFSKDLPPGWQAYWDDSIKQVYYGNQNTSETTWTRPIR